MNPHTTLADAVKEANALRDFDLKVQAKIAHGVAKIYVGQKFANPPEKVIVEVVSGFDVVARQELEVVRSEMSGVLTFDLNVMSPVTKFIAVKSIYPGDGSHDRVYLQRIADHWSPIFRRKTFIEDVLRIERTYKRKYSHW